MITIMFAKDEGKLKDIMARFLTQQGHVVTDNPEANAINVKGIDERLGSGSDRNIVIKLEDSLYREKRGEVYKSIVEAVEKPLIEYVLEKTEGNQLKAAKVLGINRNTIRTKIKRLSINVNSWKTH